MKYAESVDFSGDEHSEAEKRVNDLRFIERQFKWIGEPWHFKLAEHLEPVKVYSWFKSVKRVGDRFFFNAGTKEGKQSYDWIKNKYIGEMLSAFGKIELCLAKDNQIVKKFNPTEKIPKNPLIANILEKIS